MIEMMLINQTVMDDEPYIPPGQVEWMTPGTYQWVCPEGVTSVCAVVIGAGEESSFKTTGVVGTPGRGAGLRWKNDIRVTPGQSYPIVLGQQGPNTQSVPFGGSFVPTADGTSSALGLYAGFGTHGTPFGDGVGGGVGADGGNINSEWSNLTDGGASGGYMNGLVPRVTTPGYSGAGVDMKGGESLTGGTAAPLYASAGGRHGGGGQSRNPTSTGAIKQVRLGGFGGVRIIWGKDRAYPNKNLENVTTV